LAAGPATGIAFIGAGADGAGSGNEPGVAKR
jgi:hypothetical protein